MLIKRLQGQLEKRNGYYYEFDMHSKPLGEGGMGVVYKGFKIYEATGNRSVVAIKAMFDGLPAEVYERAEREASIRLRNDNLVEMLGFISEIEIDPYGMQKNKYYVVSEYLNGVVLSDLLTGQFKDKDGIEIPYAKQLYTDYISKKEKTSIEIIRCVLSGILALHDKGYIHRDIDPTNIMVTDEGTIKLIDFGIAKYVRSLRTIDKSLTSTGKFIGKAEFASPELVLGDVRNQGYPTDIYAIGILFYQLLVGKLPFTGSKYEVLQMQLNDKVPVKHIKNPLLAKIVKKATEKNKSDRYSSVAELRAEIDKAADSHPSIISRYWKHGVVTLLSCVACAALIFWINNLPLKDDTNHGGSVVKYEEVSIDTIQIVDYSKQIVDYSKDFNQALAKLNSKDKNIAVEGLNLMKGLAEKNCSEAIEELGITYSVLSNKDSQFPQINERREVLGFDRNTSTTQSIQYLESIKADELMSVEALYILGYSYWKQHDWEKGEETLSKALEKISTSSESTFNGLPKKDLIKDIKRYLNLCRTELN